MLRLLAVFVLILGFSTAHASDIDCKVKSKNYPSLEKGWNKETHCNDLVDALEYLLGAEVVTAKIRSQNTWMRTYQVGYKFKAKVNGKRYKGTGTQYWSPDGSNFVIETLK